MALVSSENMADDIGRILGINMKDTTEVIIRLEPQQPIRIEISQVMRQATSEGLITVMKQGRWKLEG